MAQCNTLSATRLENDSHVWPRNFRDSNEIITRPTFYFNDFDSRRNGVKNDYQILNLVESWYNYGHR
jgi:hypothetical protein